MLGGAAQVKKRAMGIPRTSLTLGATINPAQLQAGGGDAVGGEIMVEGEDGKSSTIDGQLQPSAQAFRSLVKTGGGQSLSSTS
jgi:hypothetical protein